MLAAVFWAVTLIAAGGWSLTSAAGTVTTKPTAKPTTAQPSQEVVELKKQVDYLEKVVGGMARQMMLQQLFVEERIRSDGDSGLKQIR